jgi:hypothetical protein
LVLDEVIGPMRDEIIKQAAESAFSIMKDAVLFMKKQYNLWVVLAVLQDYMKVSGVNSDHRIEWNFHITVKFSLCIKILLPSIR